MYLKAKNKKIKLYEYTKFKDRIKTFRFFLKEIDFGIKMPNKKLASTYFFCHRVDICFTDKDDKILYLYPNVKTEKRIFKFKSKNIYYLPEGTCEKLKVGDIIKITKR